MVLHVKVEQVRRKTSPLGGPLADDTWWRDVALEGDDGSAAADGPCKPMHQVGVEVETKEFFEEEGVVDGVEGFRYIGGGDDGSKGGFPLVETLGNLGGEGEEGGDGGVVGGKTMLGRGAGEMRKEEGADETLEDLGGGAEQRDGAVRGADAEGFSWFGDGDDEGSLPDGGEVGVREGEVEEGGEERDAFASQLAEMKICQTVGADG